jgi:cathepsin L
MFAALVAVGSCSLVSAHEEKLFLEHLRQNGLLYTGNEYQFRLGIFLLNQQIVREVNAANRGFRLGLNSLSTLTPTEYRALLGYKPGARPATKFGKTLETTPIKLVEWDWRDSGAVQIVKDQGGCGADWAFAAIGAAESKFFIRTETLYNLSEQNLIDCSAFDAGCDGGTPGSAYEYVLGYQDGLFATADQYPYTGVQGVCSYDKATISDSAYLFNYGFISKPGDEDELLAIVASGPAAIAIDASHDSFQLYKSGIFDEPGCSSTDLDHVVLAVGFGADQSGTQYWIVKNSWGTAWGDNGYIFMSRNKKNQCGIATDVVVPLLT